MAKQLGDGQLPTCSKESSSTIKLPEELCCKIEENKEGAAKNDAISFAFDDIQENSKSENWIDFVASRAILATTNKHIDDINDMCLNKLPGEEIVLPSAESTKILMLL